MTEAIGNGARPMMHGERLRGLADAYEQAQKLRIGVGNRLGAAERGADQNEPDPFVASIGGDLKGVENKIRREMAKELRKHPAWDWLSQVKGIGPTLGAKILGLSYNCEGLIEPSGTVSQYWSFAGYAVKNGKRVVPVKGELRPYNTRLKTAIHLCGESFLKAGSPYAREYHKWKEIYRSRQKVKMIDLGVDPEIVNGLVPGEAAWKSKIAELEKEHGHGSVWNDAHIHEASLRKMDKLFMSHLWEVYRDAVGLPTRPPYILDAENAAKRGYEPHGTYISPDEFIGEGKAA